MCQTQYDIQTHRDRFASWAAARAAQRGFGKVDDYRKALEATGLRTFVEGYTDGAMTSEEFDSMHQDWCQTIVANLPKQNGKAAAFGRAAKLVAMYLKVTIVLRGMECTPLAMVAHPPIDGILLKNLAKSNPKGSEPQQRQSWRTETWTTLKRTDYDRLIQELRSLIPDGQPFWMLETYWTVATEQ